MSEFIGRTIGKYRIETLLGKGGMGQVFRAIDTNLNRPVALKLLFPQFAADPQFRARFHQEAQAAARLSHAHIVTVYDFDESDGLAYLVMELVAGGSLRAVLRDPTAPTYPATLARRIDLVRQAAEALAYAHSKGMVHRDIKPDNLMLQPQPNGTALLKVVDFGLARLAEGGGRTATGIAMGTPAYMSPEQFRNAKDVDARTDIYALGVVLFEVITGMLPFRAATMAEAVFQHLQLPPPIPSTVRPDLPPELDAIVARCLAKRPDDRFATAAALATALRAFTNDNASMSVSGVFITDTPSTFEQAAQNQATVVQRGAHYVAPRVAALVGPSDQPRVQVINADGSLRSVVNMPLGETTIGRLADNAIVLPGNDVSRRHLRVAWDGEQVTVIDLGSSSGSFLDTTRLVASEPCVWPWGALLRVGSCWLQLEKPQPSEEAPSSYDIGGASLMAARPSQIQEEGVAPISVFAATGRFAVLLEPETLTVTPGRATMMQVTVTNVGDIVDHADLRVAGVPRDWVSAPGMPQLNPGGRASVTLTIQAPLTPETRAGEYAVEIQARSRAHSEERGVALARWIVQPFTRGQLDIHPTLARGVLTGNYRLTLQNNGNAPTHYRLAVDDESGELRCELTSEELSIAAGEQASALLKVEKSPRLAGAPRTYGIGVSAHGVTGESELHTTIRYVQTALLPTWALPLLGLLLVMVTLYGAAFPAGLWNGVPGSGFLLNPTAESDERRLAAAATTQAGDAATAQAEALSVAAVKKSLEAAQTATLAALQAMGQEGEQTVVAAAFEATSAALGATQTAAVAVMNAVETTSISLPPAGSATPGITPTSTAPIASSVVPTVTASSTATRTTMPSITSAPTETPAAESPTAAPTVVAPTAAPTIITPVATATPTATSATPIATSITPTIAPTVPTADTIPPDTTLTGGPAGSVAANTVSFTFTSEPGATFECRLDGAAFAPCASPHNLAGIGDGSHVFDVRAVDQAGNRDPSPATRTWTVDTIPPNTTVNSGPTGMVAMNDATFTFSTNEPATFECRVDGAPFAVCANPHNLTGLNDGFHAFEVRAIDAAGNIDATPATRTWIVDTTPPDTGIASGPQLPINSTSAAFAFSATETDSMFECSLDGAAFVSCTSPMSYSGLAEGSHIFAVRAIDAVGNTDPSPASRAWTVDMIAPDTIISSFEVNPDATVATVSFSANEAGTFECRVDTAPFAPCVSPQNISGLPPGSHTFEVRARDIAGNIDPTPAVWLWTSG